ncbi:MAG TPA: DUF4241 domain-containing protein [Streptosporangiaceae bacterium]|nr:DUF4241 domain-containing protein [Streptosporangiaceae bacterium]
MPLIPPDFDQWFAASAGTESDGTRFGLHQDTGWLWLPSGRLVAAQPISYPDPGKYAFTQTVPPGRYPVGLLIAEYPRSGPGAGTAGATIEYVAAARLVIRDEPAATWGMAVRPGQDPSDLDDDSFFGFPVDGGMACFTDAQTLLTLDALEIPDTDEGEHWAHILNMDVSDSRASLSTLTDPSHNEAPVVVGFSTGGGDGRYPTWVGRTAQGDITCFATDFMLAGAQPVP